MSTTVELQEMFSYSFILLIIAASLLAVLSVMGFIVFWRMRKQSVNVPIVTPAPKMKPVHSVNVKQKYRAVLNDLEKNCHENKISGRAAYQQLSQIVRRFVYEATGIKVHNYTLEEIRQLNMPDLYSVIAECYAPEFAVENNSNIYDTLQKARKVIEEWN